MLKDIDPHHFLLFSALRHRYTHVLRARARVCVCVCVCIRVRWNFVNQACVNLLFVTQSSAYFCFVTTSIRF